MPLFYYHIIAFFAGFVLDAILGDPYRFPHPVKFMGMLISKLEKHYLGEKNEKETPTKEVPETIRKKRREQGRQTVLIVLVCTLLVTDVLLIGGYLIHPILGCIIETVMTYQALAAKCLVVESMKVYKALTTGT
ncbi:MAG: cobalamin biosynthesis protein, partial [Lachnospiraceae bacterium]|nr:cobalamin biosynthesis protein [Lachnospiraceae bacterium]